MIVPKLTMIKQTLILVFNFLVIFSFSQNKPTSYPNFIGQNLISISENPDWNILEKANGDLNNDGKLDVALILESRDSLYEKRCDPCYVQKNKARIILILLNQHNSQKVIIQNNLFIARGDEGGMAPYIEPELSIKNHLLNIDYQYTRSHLSYTFKFKNNRMILVSAKNSGVTSATGDFESNSFDFIKNIIVTETGNISEEESKIDTLEINVKPKILSEFRKMYDWQVAKFKYL